MVLSLIRREVNVQSVPLEHIGATSNLQEGCVDVCIISTYHTFK